MPPIPMSVPNITPVVDFLAAQAETVWPEVEGMALKWFLTGLTQPQMTRPFALVACPEAMVVEQEMVAVHQLPLMPELRVMYFTTPPADVELGDYLWQKGRAFAESLTDNDWGTMVDAWDFLGMALLSPKDLQQILGEQNIACISLRFTVVMVGSRP